MSLEAEQAIIASIIDSDASYDLAVEKLNPQDFTDDRMRLMFELITKLKDAGKPTDAITMGSALAASKRWANTGLDDPIVFVHALVDVSRSFVAVSEYIELVKTASVAQTLFDYCNEIYTLTRAGELSGDEMLAQASQLLPSVDNVSGVVDYRDVAKRAMDNITRRAKGELIGISTGLANLDKLMLGFEPGTLTIVAGRPSHGKSLYGQMFAHTAAKQGPVYFYSLEMTPENIGERAIASIGHVDFGDLRSGKIDHQMQESIDRAAKVMSDLPIIIDDRSGIHVNQIVTRTRALSRKEKPALIVIDYLQLIKGTGDNRTAQIGDVSRTLKALAKELHIPVVCLSQLNRNVDSRTDSRPVLSDLRDSGEIEQDADVVLFTYLVEKYIEDTPRLGIGELICAKQRNGPTGSIYTNFQGRYQTFTDHEGVLPPMYPEREPKEKGKGISSFVGNAAINDEGGF